jgi:GNAT superfamily N-acetyltransferase
VAASHTASHTAPHTAPHARPGVTVEPADSRAQIEEFIRFPFALYRGEPHWVPPLLQERRDFLNPQKNPVYEYSKLQPFLARRDGRVAGTVVAIRNERYGQFHADERNVGFFGLYECADDPEVSQALLAAAAGWLAGEGFGVMRGPVNVTTNDVLGLLVEGFDDDPALLMPYNPRYYEAQLESFGLRKSKDLLAFEAIPKECAGKLDAIAEKLLERGRCTLRPVNLKRFHDELEFVRRCYNEAWKDNWGFVPWTDRELEFLAKELKPMVDPRMTFVGEIGGEPAAIAISIPDANEGLKLAKGRLFPTGLLKILWRVKVRGCDRVRTVAFGVMPQYRRLGLETVMIQRSIQSALAVGFTRAELSWILEDNQSMLRPLRRLPVRRSKVYRIYDRPIP